MDWLTLEETLRSFGREIENSKLIETCVDVAESFGVGGRERTEDGEFAGAEYTYERGELKIHIQTYAMGQHHVMVRSNGKLVFEAMEQPNKQIKYPNPAVKVGNTLYEVLAYKPGSWNTAIDNLYRKSNSEVPARTLKGYTARFGI